MKVFLKILISTFGILFILASSSIRAEEDYLGKVNESIKKDLVTSAAYLTSVQEEVGQEKTELSRQLLLLEAENRKLLDDAKRVGLQRDGNVVSFENLKKEVSELADTVAYIENLIQDYANAFNREISVGEKQLFSEVLNPLIAYGGDKEISDQLASIETGFDFLGKTFQKHFASTGGYTYGGTAILHNGLESGGKFIQVGPFLYFSPETGSGAGLIDLTDAHRARVFGGNKEIQAGEVKKVAQSGQGWLYFDPSLYDAIEISRMTKSWTEEIEKGGIWIFPILFFAGLSVIVAFLKAIQIYRVHRPSDVQVQQLITSLKEGNKEEALKSGVDGMNGPMGDMLRAVVKYSHERKDLVEEILYERMLEAQSSLERFLPLIAITMATAPLLGLLGTVTGMIETFRQIMLFGSSDMGNLAGGISEALVTTKYGLISAIPALIIHSLLSRKVQGILSDMEKTGSSILNALQSDNK
jgi:biopolymer transport protein ExbB